MEKEKLFSRKPKAGLNSRIPGSKASSFRKRAFRVEKVNDEKDTAHLVIIHDNYEEKVWLSVPAAMVHSGLKDEDIFDQEGTSFAIKETLLISHEIDAITGEKWIFHLAEPEPVAEAEPVAEPIAEAEPVGSN